MEGWDVNTENFDITGERYHIEIVGPAGSIASCDEFPMPWHGNTDSPVCKADFHADVTIGRYCAKTWYYQPGTGWVHLETAPCVDVGYGQGTACTEHISTGAPIIRMCLHVEGSGNHVEYMEGWDVLTGDFDITGERYHIEIVGPGGHIANCDEFPMPWHHNTNSPVCKVDFHADVTIGRYCAKTWYYQPGTGWVHLETVPCVDVGYGPGTACTEHLATGAPIIRMCLHVERTGNVEYLEGWDVNTEDFDITGERYHIEIVGPAGHIANCDEFPMPWHHKTNSPVCKADYHADVPMGRYCAKTWWWKPGTGWVHLETVPCVDVIPPPGTACTGESFLMCFHVEGSGNHVEYMEGWDFNDERNMTGDRFHIEILGPAGHIANCDEFPMPWNRGTNSPVCKVDYHADVAIGRYCAKTWWWEAGTGWVHLGPVPCVDVHN